MENPQRPVYSVVSTHRTAMQMTWVSYSSAVIGADFSVPLECAAPKNKKPMGGMMNLFNLGGLSTPLRPF